jgi:5-bromo-4-chloroindolyl phosphate hydrolysis protein
MRGKYSSVRGIERGDDQAMSETEILKRNVRELQEQLQNSHIRIKKLKAKLMKYEKLLDMLRRKP